MPGSWGLAAARGLISSGNQAKNTGAVLGEVLHMVGPEQPLLSLVLEFLTSANLPLNVALSFLALPPAVRVPSPTLALKNSPLQILTLSIGVLFGGGRAWLLKTALSESLLQILMSFVVVGEHPFQQELSVENGKLQLDTQASQSCCFNGNNALFLVDGGGGVQVGCV